MNCEAEAREILWNLRGKGVDGESPEGLWKQSIEAWEIIVNQARIIDRMREKADRLEAKLEERERQEEKVGRMLKTAAGITWLNFLLTAARMSGFL